MSVFIEKFRIYISVIYYSKWYNIYRTAWAYCPPPEKPSCRSNSSPTMN